tara:strand:+ start:678 stop:1604 length:927 start_codon:yes stop_codon:yes gene_type:complete
MFTKKIYLILILFLYTSLGVAEEKIFIKLKVNDYIITNIDIKKEAEYLKILNPNISDLNDSKILNLAKDSIINEIIKRDEIKNFFTLDDKNFVDDELLKDLTKKLSLSQNEFENLLKQKQSYTLSEVKAKLKIDILWNDLVYYRFNKQVKIDENSLAEKVDKLKSNQKKQYLLSEIIFEKKQDKSLSEYANQIKESIKEIGFNNTANIFSIADSSKFGGKIGWVDESNLSKVIVEKLKILNENENTDVIQIGNNYLILMIEKIKIEKITVDKKEVFKNLVKFETNRQLNQFSKIYFNKVSVNYKINEK